MDRRQFLVYSTGLTAGALSGAMTTGSLSAKGINRPSSGNITARIPMPIQVVIDDVGWWSGEDGSLRQEPFRTGIKRNHVPADYKAITELGRKLGIKPQAAMVLCEWDKENILSKLPTSTWMGEKWDNRKWVGPWMEEAIDIIRSNDKNIELTIHGLGHEYWVDGKFTRAEWATKDGVMRPADQVEKHLEFFYEIMKQHNMGELPSSFVPTAFCHSFGISRGNTVSIAELLKKRGVFYINTPFSIMANAGTAENRFFGIDGGVMTVDRGEDLFDWKVTGVPPAGTLKGPVCGMHWPNLLHPDPLRNMEIVEEWVRFLKPYNYGSETVLAADSLQFLSQLAHYECSEVILDNNAIEIDFSKTDKLNAEFPSCELFIKLKSEINLSFTSPDITLITERAMVGEDPGYLLKLRRKPGTKKATVRYTPA